MAVSGRWIIYVVSLSLFAWIVATELKEPPEIYSCSPSNPNQEIDASKHGIINSPTGLSKDKYPDNQDCSWKLKASLGKVVRIKITLLSLEKGDSLTISDGDTAHGGNLIAKYSLCMKGSLSLFSTGSAMFIQFKSDDKESDRGFSIEYKTVKRSQVVNAGKVNNICSFRSVSRSSSGYLASPKFPNSLQNPISCVWHVVSPKDKATYLSYKVMGLVPKDIPVGNFGTCKFDYVRQFFKSRSDKFCGCDLPSNEKGPVGTDAYVEMMAGKSYNQPGFLIYHKAIDESACPDAKTCSSLTDDRDVGFDRRGNILYEKEEVTRPPPTRRRADPRPPRIGPFRVQCYADEIRVALNVSKFSLLDVDTATLVDPKCKSYRKDSTHVFLKSPLDGCGTTHNYSSDGRYIIYYNQISMKPTSTSSDLITRDHDAVFEFECRYHRSAVMSVVHYTPSRADVFTRAENIGNFTFMMQMYKSKKYENPYEDYPVHVMASKEIYIQTEVKANDTELVLNIDKCVVTPSKNPNDKEFYDLITKSCPVDETLKYDHKLSSVQRFNFKAFYFNVDKKATVHVHCTVRVCRRADKNSRCVKGCSFKRLKRSAPGAVEEDEITGRLSIGPIELQEQSQQGQSGQLSDSPKMFVQIVVGVLGFFVVVLLAAVVTVMLKKKPQPKKHTLIVQDNIEG